MLHGSQILVSLIDPVEPQVEKVTEPEPHSCGWYRSLAAAIVKPYDLPHSTVGGESRANGAAVTTVATGALVFTAADGGGVM